jgi:phosphomevalonate kinase
MNLITPKELEDLETCTLLDYLCVAVNEAYVEVERFEYPSKVKVIFLKMGDKKSRSTTSGLGD